MFKTLRDLNSHRNLRHKHTSTSLCNALNKENNVTPFVLFSMAFIWHCHINLNIDLFDNDDIDDLNVHKLYLRYPDISNKEMLNNFFINSKSVFKYIKMSHMKRAIQLFEEDNGGHTNSPHGYIASTHNIRQITNEFTKSMFFTLNEQDAQMVSNELSCR